MAQIRHLELSWCWVCSVGGCTALLFSPLRVSSVHDGFRVSLLQHSHLGYQHRVWGGYRHLDHSTKLTGGQEVRPGMSTVGHRVGERGSATQAHPGTCAWAATPRGGTGLRTCRRFCMTRETLHVGSLNKHWPAHSCKSWPLSCGPEYSTL